MVKLHTYQGLQLHFQLYLSIQMHMALQSKHGNAMYSYGHVDPLTAFSSQTLNSSHRP